MEKRWEVCRMRLGQKNLLYSIALASVMMLFLIGYFIYMLPSLYVDHVMEQNLKSIYEQHNAYMEKRSYEGVRVKNATACFSVEIPWKGDFFFVTGKSYSARITVRDSRLVQLLDRCRKKLETGGYGRQDARALQTGGSGENEKDAGLEDFILAEEIEELAEILQSAVSGNNSFPLELRLVYTGTMEDEFFNESMKAHTYSGDLVIIEASVEDVHNRYANYIAVEQTENSLVLSFLPVVAPDVDEIRPVVLRSLPMLGAVILLLVLLFSQMYSKGIVGPIERVAQHAREMENTEGFQVERLSGEWPDRKDEVRELADTLDDFYRQIGESYRELEEKNRELAEENRRQEIFLRASSHQLKTPIAAALLLVEGMMNEVGRYRDTKAYLPKVKEQLLSMRKMVEEILYLNHCAEECSMQPVDVRRLLEERLRSYQVELAESGIEAELLAEEPEGMQREDVETELSADGQQEMCGMEAQKGRQGEAGRPADGTSDARLGGEGLTVLTDERMVAQILDNLLSNAVKYTPREGRIQILLRSRNGMGNPEVRIENYGVTIPEELLPHIFDPFVSGRHVRNSAMGSHGLGLYIASYYAKKLDMTLTVSNIEDGVAATLVL